jgi:twitching motility two-component system response regulator PilG
MEAMECLRRILEINPRNERAQTELYTLRIQEGVAAAKAGDRERARALLSQAATDDPYNDIVWLWLASVQDDPGQVVVALDRVLLLRPDYEAAARWRFRVQKQMDDTAPWLCPLCDELVERETSRCTGCDSLLEGKDLEALVGSVRTGGARLRDVIDGIARGDSSARDPDAQLRLGVARLALGELDQALGHFEAAQSLRVDGADLSGLVTPLRERMATARPMGEAVATEAAPKKPERKVILTVDDSPTVRRIVASTLERRGYRVVMAADGVQALAVLQEVVPNLIFLDVTMPHLDGYKLCRAIKGNDLTKGVPVVMLSGKDGLLDKARGMIAGATEYLTKPFEPRTLVGTVERLVGG